MSVKQARVLVMGVIILFILGFLISSYIHNERLNTEKNNNDNKIKNQITYSLSTYIVETIDNIEDFNINSVGVTFSKDGNKYTVYAPYSYIEYK